MASQNVALDDMLMGFGLDKEAVCFALRNFLLGARTAVLKTDQMVAQRVRDSLAVLDPKWAASERISAHEEALQMNSQHAAMLSAQVQQMLQVIDRDYRGRWREAPVDLVESYARQWNRLLQHRDHRREVLREYRGEWPAMWQTAVDRGVMDRTVATIINVGPERETISLVQAQDIPGLRLFSIAGVPGYTEREFNWASQTRPESDARGMEAVERDAWSQHLE